jgi:hypothetical protein
MYASRAVVLVLSFPATKSGWKSGWRWLGQVTTDEMTAPSSLGHYLNHPRMPTIYAALMK